MPYTKQYIHRLRIAFMTICLVSAISVAVGVVVAVQLYHRVGHESALIQQQRYDTVLAACRDQNGRHDETVKRLDDIIAKLPPSARVHAREGERNTILLINALVPKRDCMKVVEQAVKPVGP